jgi:hypothetical protein
MLARFQTLAGVPQQARRKHFVLLILMGKNYHLARTKGLSGFTGKDGEP